MHIHCTLYLVRRINFSTLCIEKHVKITLYIYTYLGSVQPAIKSCERYSRPVVMYIRTFNGNKIERRVIYQMHSHNPEMYFLVNHLSGNKFLDYIQLFQENIRREKIRFRCICVLELHFVCIYDKVKCSKDKICAFDIFLVAVAHLIINSWLLISDHFLELMSCL